MENTIAREFNIDPVSSIHCEKVASFMHAVKLHTLKVSSFLQKSDEVLVL